MSNTGPGLCRLVLFLDNSIYLLIYLLIAYDDEPVPSPGKRKKRSISEDLLADSWRERKPSLPDTLTRYQVKIPTHFRGTKSVIPDYYYKMLRKSILVGVGQA